jgi:hypothetical protein
MKIDEKILIKQEAEVELFIPIYCICVNKNGI